MSRIEEILEQIDKLPQEQRVALIAKLVSIVYLDSLPISQSVVSSESVIQINVTDRQAADELVVAIGRKILDW